MSRLAAIIVNYGTADLALKAAASLLSQPSGADLEIFLIDNPAGGDDAERLRRAIDDEGWSGRVSLYCNSGNIGFGRANNLAFRELASRPSPPDFVLMMNPDAHVRSDAVARLRAALEANPTAAFAGPLIRLTSTGALRQAAFRFPHLGTLFQRALDSPRLNAWRPDWRIGIDSGSERQRVDWVSGAFVLARFQAVMELGGFDDRFFLYWEEVDLMHRAARAEWHTLHVPNAEVFHVEGASTGLASYRTERPEFPDYYYDSWRLYFVNARGRAYALMAAILWLTGSGLHLAICRIRRTTPAKTPVDVLRRIWGRVIRPLIGFGKVQSGRSR